MSKICQVTGKIPQSGNNVSHAKNRTKRKFFPNLHTHKFWVESENRFVNLKVSAKGMRIIDKKGQLYSETLDNWKYIVGKELFKECYPKSFRGSNKVKNSCLTIMVKRGSEVNLEYSKNEIIKKMNAFFGYEVVQTIKLNTFDGFLEKKLKKSPDYATKNKHIKDISNIKNEKVRNSLIELSNLYKKK